MINIRPETAVDLHTGTGWTVTISPEGNGGRRSVIVSRHGVPILSGTVSSLPTPDPAVWRAVQVLAGADGVSDPVGLAAELVAAGVIFPEGAE